MVRLRRIDVLKLRVAVWMFRAFIRLAIELAREAEFDQFLAHGVGADRMSHRRQRFSQFVHALGDRYQGPHGVAQGPWFDETLEFRNEAGINLGNSPTPAAGAANLVFRKRFRIQIVFAAIDRRAGKTSNPRHDGETTPPSGSHLNGCPRSSRLRPTVSHRYRMAPSSIIKPTYACSPKSGIPASRVQTHASRARFSYCSECPKRCSEDRVAMQTVAPPIIRAYRPTDLDAVISIFLAAIRETASRDYTPAQIDAWAQVDRDGWAVRRLSRPTWIAVIDESAVGFTDLEPDGHLDMMFVRPTHQGVGVATALFNTVEAAARSQGLSWIFTEASITARPFFERRGLSVVSSQLVGERGPQMRIYRMEKLLK
jgi:putative acetyltransferase